jgi:hypothetical protein
MLSLLDKPELEDPAEGVDDGAARLLACLALAVRAGDLGDRRDHPTVLALFVDESASAETRS